jgi:hypothetical protein
MLRKASSDLSPAGRIAVVVLTAIIALAILVFLLTRSPSRPVVLEPAAPFGAPGATPPPESAK